MAGQLYFRGRPINPADHGASFPLCLNAAASRVLPELFPHLVATTMTPAELSQLLEGELSGPSPKFLGGDLGILELDSGRYVPACSGVVPRRVQEYIEAEGGIGGTTLLARFGAPPYGYTVNVVKACVAGLLRAGKLRIQPEGGAELTAIRDAGVRELFEDKPFRRATLFPAGEDDIGPQVRARICKFFEAYLSHTMDREDHHIADAVALHFPTEAQRLRDVLTRLTRLPDASEPPAALTALGDVLEQCVRSCRQTAPTVKLVKRHLDRLRDGFELLKLYDAELTPEAMAAVREAAEVRSYHAAQLREGASLEAEVAAAIDRVENHLNAERPWRDVAALGGDLQKIRDAYRAERGRLLEWQEQQAEKARGRVKAREGFSTLSADDSHRILRPLAVALTNTTDDAVAPPLSALTDPFVIALRRAEDEANERLDQMLSAGDRPMVRKVDLSLRNREIKDEADLEALLDEIRSRVLELIKAKVRVRLV
jgi:hypothetical protein